MSVFFHSQADLDACNGCQRAHNCPHVLSKAKIRPPGKKRSETLQCIFSPDPLTCLVMDWKERDELERAEGIWLINLS